MLGTAIGSWRRPPPKRANWRRIPLPPLPAVPAGLCSRTPAGRRAPLRRLEACSGRGGSPGVLGISFTLVSTVGRCRPRTWLPLLLCPSALKVIRKCPSWAWGFLRDTCTSQAQVPCRHSQIPAPQIFLSCPLCLGHPQISLAQDPLVPVIFECPVFPSESPLAATKDWVRSPLHWGQAHSGQSPGLGALLMMTPPRSFPEQCCLSSHQL